MIAAITHPNSLRSALDAALFAWAAVEILLRLANRNAEQGADPTFLLVVASVVLGINLGFGAAHEGSHLIGPPGALAGVGLAVLIAGAGLRIWSILTLGRLFTFMVTIQDNHQLVDRGPYRILRHPSYTGGLIALAAIGIAVDNWLSVAALLLIPLAAVLIRIYVEETRLREGLGQSYRDYQARTWRLIPTSGVRGSVLNRRRYRSQVGWAGERRCRSRSARASGVKRSLRAMIQSASSGSVASTR